MIASELRNGRCGGWSTKSATNAYLDTVKLLKNDNEKRLVSSKTLEAESSEFISALAAGMSAQLIVEVSSEASPSTVALAAAARQTGGRLVCILPEKESLAESKEVINDSGLKDVVEFKVGDPYTLLPKYENIDFSVVDCKTESYRGLLKLLDVNPTRSVVVANNLAEGKDGLAGDIRGVNEKSSVRSMKNLIGKGMEVTVIQENGEPRRITRRNSLRTPKSKWVMKVDKENGEKHIYRLPRTP